MKKIIKYLFLALFAGFTMVSCDFLDVVPAEKASDKDAFSSPKAAERFLYSCYGYIPQINMVQTCLDFSGDEIISPFTQESYVKFAEGVYTRKLNHQLLERFVPGYSPVLSVKEEYYVCPPHRPGNHRQLCGSG
jgi:hypothetical protein